MDAATGVALRDAARHAFPLIARVSARGYLVGGAVRDLVLGRLPRDADIAIGGAADEAARFAAKSGGRMTALSGAPFDVVRVTASGVVYDFAEIVGASIEDDLSRRDFTIGAIALPLDAARDAIDPFGGIEDLDSRLLRMVRESNFDDDPLRVLRGVRLATELALRVDGETLAAMRRHAEGVAECASERMGTEWLALLEAEDAVALRQGLELLRELGLDQLVAGATLDAMTIERVAKTGEPDAVTRLAAIALGGNETALCDAALRTGLGSSRVGAIRRTCRLARILDATTEMPIDPVALHDEGEDAARRAVAIVRASGKHDVADLVARFIAREGARVFGARPLLDGLEIAAITSLPPGPRIGAIRRALLVAQLRGEVWDEAQARELVEKHAVRSE